VTFLQTQCKYYFIQNGRLLLTRAHVVRIVTVTYHNSNITFSCLFIVLVVGVGECNCRMQLKFERIDSPACIESKLLLANCNALI